MENAKKRKQYNLAFVVAGNWKCLEIQPRENATNATNALQCDYTFIKIVDLRRHLLTHAGEKNHKCDQCDFGTLALWQAI